jgi:hypothetical protein
MFKFFNIGKPGPTDLDWEQKNSADYLYRPADLTALKEASRQENVEPQEKREESGQKSKKERIQGIASSS